MDAALGFVGTFGYFVIFIVTLSIGPMMASPNFGQTGTFYLFGTLSFFAAVWCHFELKETSGDLTDKEKKELYIPKELLQKAQEEDEDDSNSKLIVKEDETAF